jgi:hypothetical protein
VPAAHESASRAARSWPSDDAFDRIALAPASAYDVRTIAERYERLSVVRDEMYLAIAERSSLEDLSRISDLVGPIGSRLGENEVVSFAADAALFDPLLEETRPVEAYAAARTDLTADQRLVLDALLVSRVTLLEVGPRLDAVTAGARDLLFGGDVTIADGRVAAAAADAPRAFLARALDVEGAFAMTSGFAWPIDLEVARHAARDFLVEVGGEDPRGLHPFATAMVGLSIFALATFDPDVAHDLLRQRATRRAARRAALPS